MKIENLPPIVKQDLLNFVPSSLMVELSSFIFYDKNPKKFQDIDLIICTNRREIIELGKKQIIRSVLLNSAKKPSDIYLYRNMSCDLYYLVLCEDELVILSSNETLTIDKRYMNVERISIEDNNGKGVCSVKVYSLGDAVPMLLNEKLELVNELSMCSLNTSPVESWLKRKITMANHSVASNKKVLNDYRSLRNQAAYALLKKMHPSLKNTVWKDEIENVYAALKVKMEPPWLRICSDKVVIVFDSISNDNCSLIEDLQILLYGKQNTVMSYQSNIYEKTQDPPFWKQTKLNNQTEISSILALTVVMNLEDLRFQKNICFKGIFCYKMEGRIKYLPFHETCISFLEIIDEKYQLFSGNKFDQTSILATMALNNKTDLVFKNIKKQNIELSNILCEYLSLEQVFQSVVVHKKSPYHTLNGILLVIQENGFKSDVAAYTRNENQLQSLLACIQDMVPHQILVTRPNHIVKFKDEKSENEPSVSRIKGDYKTFGYSVLRQMNLVKDYYDNCLSKMHEKQLNDLVNIELCNDGLIDLKNSLYKESLVVQDCMNKYVETVDVVSDSESMFVDSD